MIKVTKRWSADKSSTIWISLSSISHLNQTGTLSHRNKERTPTTSRGSRLFMPVLPLTKVANDTTPLPAESTSHELYHQ
jgi:hypothetical protein